MKKDKYKDIKSITFALVYFFRQAAGLLSLIFKNITRATFGGNIDPTYLFGFAYIKDVLWNKEKREELFICLLPIIVIIIPQLLLSTPVSALKYVITLVKLLLCILIMLYVKNKLKTINLYRFALTYTIIAGFFTVISLFIQNTITWRYNDYVNSFDLTRLQLFYLEPSELGFHVSIIIMILLCLLLSSSYRKYRRKIFLALLVNIFILYLSKALGAIAILIVTIFISAIFLFTIKPTKNSLLKFTIFAVLGFVSVALLFVSGSSIGDRFQSVASGNDGSVNYRLNVSFEVLGRSLPDYGFFGAGFGNVNTDEFISRYSDQGLVQMIVNSFVYFWTETGIIGFVVWLLFMFYLFHNCIRKRDGLAFALLVFIFLYQFVGGHYTSGLNWVIYGYVLSGWKWIGGNSIATKKVELGK